MAVGIFQFRVVPAADLFQDEVDRPQREAAAGTASWDPRRAEEERRGAVAGVAGAFLLQIVGEGLAGIGGEEDGALRATFPLHPGQPALPRLA